MSIVTMITMKHAMFTYSLLSQLYYCQDRNAFLTEEVLWLGPNAKEISLFTNFHSATPLGRNKVGLTTSAGIYEGNIHNFRNSCCHVV